MTTKTNRLLARQTRQARYAVFNETVALRKRYAGYGVGPDGEFTVPADGGDTDTGNETAEAFRSRVADALKRADESSVVCAAINWITDQVSTTPLVLQRQDTDGDLEVVPSHPLLDLLNSPSEFLSGQEFRSVTIWDMVILGQAFWHKERTRAGQVAELAFLPGRLVKVIGNRDKLITGYLYEPGDNVRIVYLPEEIVHIRIEPNPRDPKNGLSPLKSVGPEIYIDMQAEEYTSHVLTSHGAPGGLLMPPEEAGILSPEVAKETKDYIHGEYSGRNRGKLGVLRTFMEYVETGLDPTKVTLKTVQTTAEERICGAIGVHPVILGLGAGAAQSRVGAATKELERAAWANRIIPLQGTISEQIARQLLPDFVDEGEVKDWELDFDRSQVPSLQPDMFQESQRWVGNVRAGIATQYDARLAQGMEADDSHKVFLYPSSITVTPEGELPAVAEPVADIDPSGDPEGTNDPEERSRVAQVYLAAARTKADLNPDQRAVLVALAQDAEVLEAEFRAELETAFEDLGTRAVDAFWEVEGGEAIRQGLSNGSQTKQTPEEIEAETNRILRAMRIEQWEQGILIPAWDGHTLRTLNTTVGSINTVLEVGVNIPDPVARRVIANGGLRRGLIDFSQQARDSLFRSLTEGRTLGEGPVQLAQRIRQQVPAGPFVNAGPEYRSRLIARTETKAAQNASTIEAYRAADTITALLIVDAQIGDTDDICEGLDGQQISFEEADDIGLLEHPNCTRSFSAVVGGPR